MAEGIKEEIVSKLIDSLPALLSILGTVFLILGLAGGITYNQFLPISEIGARIGCVVAGVLLVAIGVLNWRKHVAAPKVEKYGIKIQSPRDGARVDLVDVSGTIKSALPEGYALKVLRIYPGSEGYVPIGEARIDNKEGTWIAEQCSIGGKTGDRRWIAVYLVGPGGAVLLDYYSKAVRVHKAVMDQLRSATGKEGEYLPLIERRTPDMIECARVSVIRS